MSNEPSRSPTQTSPCTANAKRPERSGSVPRMGDEDLLKTQGGWKSSHRISNSQRERFGDGALQNLSASGRASNRADVAVPHHSPIAPILRRMRSIPLEARGRPRHREPRTIPMLGRWRQSLAATKGNCLRQFAELGEADRCVFAARRRARFAQHLRHQTKTRPLKRPRSQLNFTNPQPPAGARTYARIDARPR